LRILNISVQQFTEINTKKASGRPSAEALLTYLHTYFSIYYLLTPWSRVLLEKLTGSQLVKKFLHSHVPTTYPYPEPAGSSSYPHIPLPEDAS
jgi:hypothetical protein